MPGPLAEISPVKVSRFGQAPENIGVSTDAMALVTAKVISGTTAVGKLIGGMGITGDVGVVGEDGVGVEGEVLGINGGTGVLVGLDVVIVIHPNTITAIKTKMATNANSLKNLFMASLRIIKRILKLLIIIYGNIYIRLDLLKPVS